MTAPSSPSEPSTPHAGPLVLDAVELRRLAEFAASVRTASGGSGAGGGTARSVQVGPRAPGKKLPFTVVPRGTEAPPGTLVIPVATENRVDERSTIDEMKLDVTQPGGNRVMVDLFEACRQKFGTVPDAMFWTESAVQKFLLPYYAGVYSASRGVGGEVDRVNQAFDGAQGHTREPDGAEGSRVFALIHLPHSEYVAEQPSPEFARVVADPTAEGGFRVEGV